MRVAVCTTVGHFPHTAPTVELTAYSLAFTFGDPKLTESVISQHGIRVMLFA